MTPRSAIALCASLVVAGAWVACKSDYDAETPTGDERQPCFANGTCLNGLTCLSNVCVVAVDAATASSASSSSASSASSSGGTSASSSSSSGDAGIEHDFCGDLSNSDQVVCPADPSDLDCKVLTPFCCAGNGCTEQQTCAGPAADSPFRCFSSRHCGGAQRCCIPGKVSPTIGAPVCGLSQVLELGSNAARSSCTTIGDACGSGQVELCSMTGEPCTNGVCRPALFKLKASNGKTYTRTLRVCNSP